MSNIGMHYFLKVYQWWLDDMYMNVPLALPVNSNPGMVFPKQEFSSIKEMLTFATRIICNSLDMNEKIEMQVSFHVLTLKSLNKYFDSFF